MAARIVRYLRKRGKVVHRVDTINEKFPPIEVAPPHKSLATINHSPGVGIEVVILAIKPHQKAKGIIMQMLAKGINNLWIQENYHWNETELGQEILQFAVVKGVKVHVGNLMLEGVQHASLRVRPARRGARGFEVRQHASRPCKRIQVVAHVRVVPPEPAPRTGLLRVHRVSLRRFVDDIVEVLVRPDWVGSAALRAA